MGRSSGYAPSAQCPLRPLEACRLCVPGATGPQDCPTVALVMADAELREELRLLRAELRSAGSGAGALSDRAAG